ncbi:hypothetical protein [Cellulomonas endophytica]|uniref:hypothetical protein n=1 Tax=Cellulomonas endophytica TaxID=2494735 RepID=UPI001011DDDE|nr:hypothetical protein [Cellulomonas endophytica]
MSGGGAATGATPSGRAPDAGAGLGRGLTALLAVVVVLVLAFAGVLLWTLMGGSGGGAPAGAGDPGASSGAPGDGGATTPAPPPGGTASPAATPTAGPAAFRLPSGNISCEMTEERVACTIGGFSYTPPAVEGCTGAVGPVAVLDAAGASLPCVEGDPAPAADAPVLEYGETSTVGPWTCGSGTDGATCTATASGVGFRLASGAFTPLP